MRYRSTARAHPRPSAIAHTTSDCPRRISPAANTLSTDVRYVVVSANTRVLDFTDFGKRYPGANHFRLINQDIDRIGRKIEETGLGGFIIPPANGFAFLKGAAGEAIETFDVAFGRMLEQAQQPA